MRCLSSCRLLGLWFDEDAAASAEGAQNAQSVGVSDVVKACKKQRGISGTSTFRLHLSARDFEGPICERSTLGEWRHVLTTFT